MSQLDEITLLCEGEDGGEDARLLELARAAIEIDTPIARRITIRPAGSKLDLPAAMRAHRVLRRSRLVFAVRDRDFLRADQVRTARGTALSPDIRDNELKAYPLFRHCIESYLLDPVFLGRALGEELRPAGIDIVERIQQLAAARHWMDICRGTLETMNRKLRDGNRAACKTEPKTRNDAIAEAQGALTRYRAKALEVLDGFDVAREVDALDADMAADGPLWARVDGKEMLAQLEQELRAVPRLKGGELKKRLLKHADAHAVPEPLIEEMRTLLQRVELVVKGLIAGPAR